MPPRLHAPDPLAPGTLALPAAAARHAQVLRLQPGAAITLFDGRGGEWSAHVRSMRRDGVEVDVIGHVEIERELAVDIHLLVGMPGNERMDSLVEKATELGAASIQPMATISSWAM